MRIAHIADLHLGITVNGYAMIEDQRYILKQILEILIREKTDVLCIAGDVYDRSIPSAEAAVLLDEFLSSLHENHIEVMMTAGNHDSGDRLSYAAGLLHDMKIHITGRYTGRIDKITLYDAYGPVHFYLLPFIRPSCVNRYILCEEDKVKTYTEAVRYALQTDPVNPVERNVILAHQFFVGVEVDREGSEELTVGGLDAVDAGVFDEFDYGAFGHIHKPQKVKREEMRYSGTPLKYSFAEADQQKSVVIIDMKEKGNTDISFVPLQPLYDLREVKGKLQDVLRNDRSDDYVRVTLTDEEEVPDAHKYLKNIYPHLMKVRYENSRSAAVDEVFTIDLTKQKSPYEVFSEFYELRNGMGMSDTQKKFMQDIIAEVWNEEDV